MPPGMLFYYRFSSSFPKLSLCASSGVHGSCAVFCCVLFCCSHISVYTLFTFLLYVVAICNSATWNVKIFMSGPHMCFERLCENVCTLHRRDKAENVPIICSVLALVRTVKRFEFQWHHFARPVLLDQMSCGYGHIQFKQVSLGN